MVKLDGIFRSVLLPLYLVIIQYSLPSLSVSFSNSKSPDTSAADAVICAGMYRSVESGVFIRQTAETVITDAAITQGYRCFFSIIMTSFL